MVRAAHFSDLSTFPTGGHPEDEKGYTARQLGYAALECWDMTIDQLTSLIATGYPIIVLTTWHYRVAVGYSSTRITFQDSYYGENLTMTYDAFDVNWDYSNHWALLVTPWEVEVQTPSAVSLGDTFTIIATITYASPPSFPSNQYPASLPNATVTLPDGLSLGPGETAEKALGTDELTAGESINVTWTVQAESPGSHTISIEAEGKITGFVSPLPSYPESYAYEDRIGGVSEGVVEIVSPANPVEDLQILIETIDGWSLPRGTSNCLTKRLERAVWLLEMDYKDGAIRLLMVFVRTAETFRGRRLTDDQVDYLTAEAQRITHLIEG
jgi:hypothetical protein